jgi:hypothetical protein
VLELVHLVTRRGDITEQARYFSEVNSMGKLAKFFFLIMILLLAAACSSEPKQTQPVTTKTDNGNSTAPPAREVKQRDKALVRVINTVPGSVSVDVFADDQKVFESVAFRNVTPYKELSDDRHSFRVRQAGHDTTQPVAENSKDLIGGKHYTIVVMPDTNDKTAVDVVNDNITDPAADKALVRVIHASPDAGDVDVIDKQGDKKLFSGLNFQKGTSYMVLNPMRTTLEMRQEGQDKAIVTLPNANFEKGKFYTIVVTGHAKGMPKLQTLMVEDQLSTAATASTDLQENKMAKPTASK